MNHTKVLLVDDETSFVDTLKKRLSKKGFLIVTAYGGEDALEQLENNAGVEVVVLDVKMPGINGLQALAEIKKRHPQVEVIILTGNATADSAIESMKSGAFDFLMKPCDLDLLVKKIESAVQNKRK